MLIQFETPDTTVSADQLDGISLARVPDMTLRTTRTFVTFNRPFWLDKVGEPQPAGTYVVQTDEEQIEGLSLVAYRRVATTISLPLKAAPKGSCPIINIKPADLESALMRDGAPRY